MPKPVLHDYTILWKAQAVLNQEYAKQIMQALSFACENIFNEIETPQMISVLIEDLGLTSEGDKIYASSTKFSSHLIECPEMKFSPDIPEKLIRQVVLHECLHLLLGLQGRLKYAAMNNIPGGFLTLWDNKAFSTRLMPFEHLPWNVIINNKYNNLQKIKI